MGFNSGFKGLIVRKVNTGMHLTLYLYRRKPAVSSFLHMKYPVAVTINIFIFLRACCYIRFYFNF